MILCTSTQGVESAKAKVEKTLVCRGLELAPNKTKIVHLVEGFNFLGFAIHLVVTDAPRPKDNFIHKGVVGNGAND